MQGFIFFGGNYKKFVKILDRYSLRVYNESEDERNKNERGRKSGMRLWSSKADIDTAVETVKKIYDMGGSLPEPLVKAYNANLAHGRRGLVSRFYEKLIQEAPELVSYFPGKDENEIEDDDI